MTKQAEKSNNLSDDARAESYALLLLSVITNKDNNDF